MMSREHYQAVLAVNGSTVRDKWAAKVTFSELCVLGGSFQCGPMQYHEPRSLVSNPVYVSRCIIWFSQRLVMPLLNAYWLCRSTSESCLIVASWHWYFMFVISAHDKVVPLVRRSMVVFSSPLQAVQKRRYQFALIDSREIRWPFKTWRIPDSSLRRVVSASANDLFTGSLTFSERRVRVANDHIMQYDSWLQNYEKSCD